jgi:hypothetical protein
MLNLRSGRHTSIFDITWHLSIRLRLSVIDRFRPKNWITHRVETSHTPAVLALPAAMGVAVRTYLPLLQCKASGPMTGMTLSGAFAVSALSIRFRHFLVSFFLLHNLNLTDRTIKRASVALPHSLHHRPAPNALFPFSLKYR